MSALPDKVAWIHRAERIENRWLHLPDKSGFHGGTVILRITTDLNASAHELLEQFANRNHTKDWVVLVEAEAASGS